MNKNIAIYGGSFNPVHIAHTKFSEIVMHEYNIDKLFIVPTFYSPHKSNSEMVSPYDRFNMCKLAFKNVDKAFVSDIEISRQGKSYTVDTLRYFNSKYPNDKLYLIVGADMYVTLLDWKLPEEIFKIAEIITVPRDNDNYDSLLRYSKRITMYGAISHILSQPIMQLSSSNVRIKLNRHEDVSNLLNINVYEYIKTNNLYGV